MLISRLHNTESTIAQANAVSKSRVLARKIINNLTNPDKLLAYAARIYKISKQHPAANSLQREAEFATQKAIHIQNQPENVATQVIFDGIKFFKQNGKRSSPRLFAMYNRYESWTKVHVRLLTMGIGGKNFQWLRDSNMLHLTSEWFVATHARHLASPEQLNELEALLSSSGSNQSTLRLAA